MSGNEKNGTLADGGVQEDRKPVSVNDIRYAAYFVLVIAAIFVINAMESGSYRTPWPVAAVFLIIGLGLLGYSYMKAAREDRQEN